METKHTPGPWKYSFESTDPNWAIVTTLSGSIIANVNSETGPEVGTAPTTRKMPAEANARLIAKAPLLEEAREVLADLVKFVNAIRYEYPSVLDKLDSARALLAKLEEK